MSMLKYTDEKDLQRKICAILNKYGYSFRKEKDSYFCDIVEPNYRVYCEVKTHGKFAPQQLLYGLAKEGISNAKYLALANEYEIRFYKVPEFSRILSFAKRISGDLSVSPSSVKSKKWEAEAFNILGDHFLIYNYYGEFNIERKNPYIFLDDTNFDYFRSVLAKYRINVADFINTFADTWSNRSRLIIKNDLRTIMDVETENKLKAGRKILNRFDRVLIESTRIKSDKVREIIHKMDEFAPQYERRSKGKYWSGLEVSEIASDLVFEYCDGFTFVFEPFVGGGSLINDLVYEYPGVANDIDAPAVDLLRQRWDGYGWEFHTANIMTTPLDEIADWIPTNAVPLIFTNPPFGKNHGNIYNSKTGEKRKKIKIVYGANNKEAKIIGDTYGRGDLVLPAIGRMVEVIKRHGSGYLAFFSQFGVMLGRKKYVKLLRALLRDFEFLYGEVFPGSMFNGVAKGKAISFTIWKYNPNANTPHETLKFVYEDREYGLRKLPLLKDGWKYQYKIDNYKEICVLACDRFNAPSAKIFTISVSGNGSEVIPENVKKPIGFQNVPDELVYALWSTTVGYKSIAGYPVIFNEAYTHLPDFDNDVTGEILALSVLFNIITEELNGYTDGRIGFVGVGRKFVFGGPRLTKGVEYLLMKYAYVPVGESNIGDIFLSLEEGEIDDVRKEIREAIRERLERIGYWDALPVPEI